MVPPIARKANAGDTVPAKHLHTSTNKIKHPVNVVKWTPEGRRLLTGSSSGEFTLWNGMGFNFETIMAVSKSDPRVHRSQMTDILGRLTTLQFGLSLGHIATTGSSRQIKVASSSTGSQHSTMLKNSKAMINQSETSHFRRPTQNL